MAHVLGVSMPRSGHHFVEQILFNTLKSEFSYCEFYGAGCCKKIPCISEAHLTTKTTGLFLQKSHDFNLDDPLTVPSTFRMVQYRSPVPRALSDFELRVKRGLPDNIPTFRNYLVNEAWYFHRFYKKWIEGRRPDFLILTYEELTSDPFKAIQSLLRFVDISVDPDQLAAGVKKAVGWRGRDGTRFVRADVSSYRHAQHPVLANFEDLVLRNCPGYFPIRYFSGNSESSLISQMFEARKAILARDRERAIEITEKAVAQNPGEPFVAELAAKARSLPAEPSKVT
jgi:hypothetical protein